MHTRHLSKFNTTLLVKIKLDKLEMRELLKNKEFL